MEKFSDLKDDELNIMRRDSKHHYLSVKKYLVKMYLQTLQLGENVKG